MNRGAGWTFKSICLFLIQSVFNPIIFFIYIFTIGAAGMDPGSWSWEIKTFTAVETNVYVINLGLFLPFALLVYTGFLALDVYWHRRSLKTFAWPQWLKLRFSWWSLLTNLPAIGNLVMWSLGMEYNVFGFIFVLPMLMGSTANMVLWVNATRRLALAPSTVQR